MVPPETDAFKVIVCPEEYVPDGGLIVGVPSARLAVTKSVPDVADVGVVAESVTL